MTVMKTTFSKAQSRIVQNRAWIKELRATPKSIFSVLKMKVKRSLKNAFWKILNKYDPINPFMVGLFHGP